MVTPTSFFSSPSAATISVFAGASETILSGRASTVTVRFASSVMVTGKLWA